jgi:hypothetical protein
MTAKRFRKFAFRRFKFDGSFETFCLRCGHQGPLESNFRFFDSDEVKDFELRINGPVSQMIQTVPLSASDPKIEDVILDLDTTVVDLIARFPWFTRKFS